MKMMLVMLMMVMMSGALFAGMMPAEKELATFEAMVDKLMAAYNAEDAVAFYADWASMMAAICTPQVFQTMFVDNYKKTFGNYTARTINAEETVVMTDVPNGLLVYTAQFANNEKVKLAINLFKENDIWKFQQVTIQAMP
ncbi:MAG: hypothetical protein KKB51_20785 [Candidatus Riflebacteria bacterium]|nr:hypothetical protein [Candidatus Riflebacteria bacterium]